MCVRSGDEARGRRVVTVDCTGSMRRLTFRHTHPQTVIVKYLLLVVLGVTFLAGNACAAQARGDRGAAPAPLQPLAGYAGRETLLLPTRYLRPADVPQWAASVTDQRALLAELDEAITAELDDRGLRGTWIFPDRLMASVRRNPTYATDPHTLAANSLRPARRRPEKVPEPLASQLRTLIALTNARYVLYPVELRFEPHDGAGRAALHIAIIDARLAEVLWIGEVFGDASAERGPDSLASLALRFADLFVAP